MDAMLKMQKYSCLLKCRNIHTCSSSELENMLIIHRDQDNRQFPINFVLCYTTLRWRASNITKPCNNWRCGLQFTTLEHPSRSCRGLPWCHDTCPVPRASIDHRNELSATLYVLFTMTKPTANLGEIPSCFFCTPHTSAKQF